MPEQPVSEPAADTPLPDAATGSLTVPDSAAREASASGLAGADSAGLDSAASGSAGSGVAEPDADLPVVAEVDSGKFTVRLTNFTGPFDLLLQLIGKHKLDVTEIALHQVTDDFIAYIRAMGDDWDLGETSEFLLVAATLLDLKAARLLPSAEVEDEDDLALLEAGDLLFARLLQYKAYKEAAAVIADLEGIGARRWPRAVALEPRYAEALPDLVLGFGPERLLKLALKQFLPKPGPPEVSIAHIHQVRVSVREHATLIRDRLRRAGSATFGLLIADCENTLEVVARFLALLELYREGLIDFEQPVSLEEMTVRWIGGDQVEGDLDIDDYEGTPPEQDTAALDPDDINLDDLDSDPTPAEAAAALDADEDEDDEDLDDLEIEDVDYAALADAALANRHAGLDLDDAEDDEPGPADANPDPDPGAPDPAAPDPADDDRDGDSEEAAPRVGSSEAVAAAGTGVAEFEAGSLHAASDTPEATADSTEPAVSGPNVLADADAAEADASDGPGPAGPDVAVPAKSGTSDLAESEVAGPPMSDVSDLAEPGGADLAEPGGADLAEPGGADLAEPGGADLAELDGADLAEPGVSRPTERDASETAEGETREDEPGTDPSGRDESGSTGTGTPGAGHHSADRVSTNEEQP